MVYTSRDDTVYLYLFDYFIAPFHATYFAVKYD